MTAPVVPAVFHLRRARDLIDRRFAVKIIRSTQIAVVDMAPRSSPGRTVLATIQLPMPRG